MADPIRLPPFVTLKDIHLGGKKFIILATAQNGVSTNVTTALWNSFANSSGKVSLQWQDVLPVISVSPPDAPFLTNSRFQKDREMATSTQWNGSTYVHSVYHKGDDETPVLVRQSIPPAPGLWPVSLGGGGFMPASGSIGGHIDRFQIGWRVTTKSGLPDISAFNEVNNDFLQEWYSIIEFDREKFDNGQDPWKQRDFHVASLFPGLVDLLNNPSPVTRLVSNWDSTVLPSAIGGVQQFPFFLTEIDFSTIFPGTFTEDSKLRVFQETAPKQSTQTLNVFGDGLGGAGFAVQVSYIESYEVLATGYTAGSLDGVGGFIGVDEDGFSHKVQDRIARIGYTMKSHLFAVQITHEGEIVQRRHEVGTSIGEVLVHAQNTNLAAGDLDFNETYDRPVALRHWFKSGNAVAPEKIEGAGSDFGDTSTEGVISIFQDGQLPAGRFYTHETSWNYNEPVLESANSGWFSGFGAPMSPQPDFYKTADRAFTSRVTENGSTLFEKVAVKQLAIDSVGVNNYRRAYEYVDGPFGSTVWHAVEETAPNSRVFVEVDSAVGFVHNVRLLSTSPNGELELFNLRAGDGVITHSTLRHREKGVIYEADFDISVSAALALDYDSIDKFWVSHLIIDPAGTTRMYFQRADIEFDEETGTWSVEFDEKPKLPPEFTDLVFNGVSFADFAVGGGGGLQMVPLSAIPPAEPV